MVERQVIHLYLFLFVPEKYENQKELDVKIKNNLTMSDANI